MNELSELIKKTAQGDRAAFKTLYEKSAKSIYNFLLMQFRQRELAEDGLQDTFLAIFCSASRFTFFDNPMAWMLTIAKNRTISLLRKTRHEISLEEENGAAELPGVTGMEDDILSRLEADALLARLNGQDRKIVILHVVYGLKHRETAKLLNLPLGSVTWRYKRSIDLMKSIGESALCRQEKQERMVGCEKSVYRQN